MQRSMLSLLLTLFCAANLFAQTPVRASQLIEGTRTDTALGGGTWRAWFNSGGARLLCANSKALWFFKGSVIWRYNVSQKKVDLWTTALTHPDLNDFQLYAALAGDGKLAVSCRAAILLWDGHDWSRLPQPEGNANSHQLAFDAKGNLWADNGNKAYQWEGRQWGLGIEVPQNSGMWALGESWFVYNNNSGRKGKMLSLVDRQFAPSMEYPKELENYGYIRNAVQVGGKLFAVFSLWNGPLRICEIRATDFTEVAKGHDLVLDISTGEGLVFNPDAQQKTGQVLSASGKKVAEFPLPPLKLRKDGECLLRDANGHYWLNHRRYDGKSWQAMTPPNAFELAANMRESLAGGRLRFDEANQTWVDAWPEIPADLSAYDPVKRTGWLQPNDLRFKQPATWEQFQFASDGSRKLIRTVQAAGRMYVYPTPQFEDALGLWLNGVYRWDGKTLHAYDDGWAGRGSTKEGKPQLVRAANGNVWMYHTDRSWRKFNPAKDVFEPGEPFDDFSFKAGGRQMAVVGLPMDRAWDWNSHLGLLYIKAGGAWKPMPNPFVGDEYVTRGQEFGKAPLLAIPGKCVRGTRMLISCYLGVLEWDMERNRWAYLTPHKNMWAYYDDKGRRVLVSDDRKGTILMYEGDPFLSAAASRPSDPLESQLMQLLKRMDSDLWRVREQATREAVNLARKNPKEVVVILRRPELAKSYSPEVKSRAELVLKEVPSSNEPVASLSYEGKEVALDRMLGNSLLERMHPPMAASTDYVVKLGMDYEHASGVFVAAGAKYSTEIHNARYPDLSYVGYLLTDNTMVYLRLESPKRCGKVASLGLGVVGKGYDKNWPWADKDKNSLKSLELSPYSARIMD